MCERCLELARAYYPSLGDEGHVELLMGATCFPFGGPELIEPQLIELKNKTDGSLHGALCYADEQTTAECEEHYRERCQRVKDLADELRVDIQFV